MEILSIDNLLDVVKKLRGIKDIECDEDSVSFKYRDQDSDDISVIIKLIDEEKVSIVLPLSIPDSHIVSAMIISNLYNTLNTSFGTFAYASVVNEKAFIFLESNICTSGGIKTDNLRIQIRNFVNKINNYESVMLTNINELGPDSDFIEDVSSTGFLKVVGTVAEAMLEAWINK